MTIKKDYRRRQVEDDVEARGWTKKELEEKLANCKAQNLRLIQEHKIVMNLRLEEYKQNIQRQRKV